MNPISSIRKFISPSAATVRPARAALHAHIDVDQGIVKQIGVIQERMRVLDADIRRHDELGARILATRDVLDSAEADDRYEDRPIRDVTAERGRLADMEKDLPSAKEAARIATLIKPKLQADVDVLLKKRQELKPATDRLVWEAATEEGAQLAQEYLSAAEAMRAIAHKAFAAFTAADTIAMAKGFGEYHGSALYSELNIPLPQHPAYLGTPLGPEAAQRAAQEDYLTLMRESENTINRLLNGVR